MMNKKVIWIIVLLCCLFVFGSTPYLPAAVCTKEDPEDLYPKLFSPSLEMTAPLTAIASQIGSLFIEGEMSITMEVGELISSMGEDAEDLNDLIMSIFGTMLLYEHNLTITLEDVEVTMADDVISITPELGLATMGINVPAFNEHMVMSMSNSETCTILRPWCYLENMMFNIFDGMDVTLILDDGAITMTQSAEACVDASCSVLQPLGSTIVDFDRNNMDMSLLDPDYSFLDSLCSIPIIGGVFCTMRDTVIEFVDSMISGMALFMMEGLMEDEMEEMLVDQETGTGLLVGMISFDVAQDGCYPPAAVQECQGTGCSTAIQGAPGRGTSLVFYTLPAALMFGLLVWRRSHQV